MFAFKQLVESGVLSEQIGSELEAAFNQKIQENRDQVTAQLREEFAQRYSHDKSVMVESIDAMLGDKLTQEMTEFAQDRKALAEARANYVKKMRNDAKMMESFVAKQLAKELTEFQSDRQKVADKFTMLEKFIVHALSKEINEFAQDKRDLAETKVKLVAGAKAKLDEVKAQFIKKAAKTVQETVDAGLRGEITQLREDIQSAHVNNFGRRIFEAFAQEYQCSHLNSKSDTARLLSIVNKKEKEIAEAKAELIKTRKLAESKDREIRVQKDLMERNQVMSELLAPLSADKKTVMKELLESVQTKNLSTAYDKYLTAVMEGTTSKPKAKVLNESAEVTGDRKTRKPQAGLEILDIRKLAGLK